MKLSKQILQIIFIIILAQSAYAVQKSELKDKCSQIIYNTYFETCYSYEYNSAIYSYSIIDDNKVNSINIKKRYNFYEDQRLPKKNRVNSSDYTNSGFDRGHLQNDANFDYSEESLRETYSMSNITLQYPKTNRVSNKAIEIYQRQQVKMYRELEIFIYVTYTDKKVKDKISIPDKYHIIMENKNFNYKECFILQNDNVEYKLQDMKVQCQ